MNPLHLITTALCLAFAGCTTGNHTSSQTPNEQRHATPDRIPANPEPSGISPVTSQSIPGQ
jgi:hypothetical protein